MDLVPFLLGLNAFHGSYYTSFGDGWPSFGPAHPPAGLLDLRTLLLDLALRQTPPPLDRFSKLRLDRNSSDSRGLELRYHATWQETFQYIVWFSASFPFLPSSQLLLFTPLPAFLSYAGAQLGVYLDESASLGDIHLVSISKLPPLCLLSNFLHFLHSLSFNIYTSPLAFLQLLAFILFRYLNFPPVPLNNFLHSCGFKSFISGTPVASPQFLASILLQNSEALTHLCLSATSCIHVVSISRPLPLVSPQLLACIVIWTQYLCAHMV